MITKVALGLLLICGVNHLILGFVYLSADEFMSYHAQALQVEWGALSNNFQVLLLALIKLSAGGALAAAIVNIYLSGRALFKRRMTHIWLAPVVALTFQLPANYAVYIVHSQTPGEPPLLLASIGTVLLSIAVVLLAIGSRHS